MKKYLALTLAAMMVFGLTSMAGAEETPNAQILVNVSVAKYAKLIMDRNVVWNFNFTTPGERIEQEPVPIKVQSNTPVSLVIEHAHAGVLGQYSDLVTSKLVLEGDANKEDEDGATGKIIVDGIKGEANFKLSAKAKWIDGDQWYKLEPGAASGFITLTIAGL